MNSSFLGDTVYSYRLPYVFKRTADFTALDLTYSEISNIGFFVYEQTGGRINVMIETDPCERITERLQV